MSAGPIAGVAACKRGGRSERAWGVATYVKPLMRLYSCLIMPPLFRACSLALVRKETSVAVVEYGRPGGEPFELLLGSVALQSDLDGVPG